MIKRNPWKPKAKGSKSRRATKLIITQKYLNSLDLATLKDIKSKVDAILKKRKESAVSNPEIERIYENITWIIRNAVVEGELSNSWYGLEVRKIPLSELQFIDLGNPELEVKIHRAMDSIRDGKGRLKKPV